MKNFIVGSIVVAALAFTAGVIVRWGGPIHLYSTDQTWSGGRITIETYFDPTLGIQKRVQNIEQAPFADPRTFVVATEINR